MSIPLGKYRHFKGNLYEVVGFTLHSETLEDMVIYKALYDERKSWVRPYRCGRKRLPLTVKLSSDLSVLKMKCSPCIRIGS